MTYIIHMPQDEGKKYRLFRYPAGEAQVRLMDTELESVASADSMVIFCTIKDGDIMPLALLANALRDTNNGVSHHDTLVLPYLPYGRADRRFVLGDCAGLNTFGHLIDSLGFDLTVTLDAHSPVTKRAISNLINVSPKPFIKKTIGYILEKYKPEDLTILLPDKGANRYKEMLSGYNVVQGSKIRNTVTGEFEKFNVPYISTKAVLVVDDLCDGGGTFEGIADTIKLYPVQDKYLYVTHGIFSKGVTKLLDNYRNIFTTDSFGRDHYPKVTTMYSEPEILKEIERVKSM